MTLFTPVVDVAHRPYCGPTAIAALTGVPISRIEKMLRRCRRNSYRDAMGRKIPIKGTHTWEVVKVLKRLGCKVEEFKSPLESTFGKFVDDTKHMGAFLVEVTGHWMASHKGLFCDTWSLSGPVPIEGYWKAQRRVRRAWTVQAPTTPLYTTGEPVKMERPSKPKVDIKVARAEKILGQIKQWETKEKRAKTALKKLRAKAAYYRTTGVLK